MAGRFPEQKHVKVAQKESQLFRELSQLLLELTLDDSRLKGLFLSRVQLTPDKGTVNLYFFTQAGQEAFHEMFPILILYKPSLRRAIGSRVPSRRVPELFFKFDEKFGKQQKIDDLIESIKKTESE